MNFIEEFKARGFLYQATNLEGITDLTSEQKIVAYIGFDCTAKSLHVGSLIQIMILRLLQKHGHKPIVIVGGGTTKIGDPTWKDQARPLLSDEVIQENMDGIKDVINKFIKFGAGEHDAIMLNNDEWFREMNYLDLLQQYGRHISINRMMGFDSVKLRLEREQNLTFLEFNYMVLQAVDFVELYRKYNCRLEIGGSDQWGNIVSGIDLGRKIGIKDELFGITTPLLTTSSGTKMGKTASGAVWLSESMLSPYEYYQFWRNSEDSDVFKFMRLFTELDLQIISDYEKSSENINNFKKILAFEATKLCHGQDGALEAQETAIALFEKGVAGGAMPEFIIEQSVLTSGIEVYQLFHITGLAESGGQAKRLIRGKGAKINDQIIEDEHLLITTKYLQDGIIKLSSGKKHHLIVRAK